ncbi:tetratricopeptide repeat protein [Marinobacter sp.]|uniref:tetratricopeptide repeat protein n=1 Tax=Marinobacter sp. TaxID=50741 RepID=UPI003566D638
MTAPVERAYLLAMDLEAAGRTEEALEKYQSIIDRHGHSLFSDAASQAMDRIEAGGSLHRAMAQARLPFNHHPARPLTLRHGVVTTLLVTAQAMAVGPVVVGFWVLLAAGSLWPLIFVYFIGAPPAALAGILLSVWGLWLCHHKQYVPKGFVLMGGISGTLSVPAWFAFWSGFDPAILDPGGVTMLLTAHGAVAGLVVGWLAESTIRLRMSLAYPPYTVEGH